MGRRERSRKRRVDMVRRRRVYWKISWYRLEREEKWKVWRVWECSGGYWYGLRRKEEKEKVLCVWNSVVEVYRDLLRRMEKEKVLYVGECSGKSIAMDWENGKERDGLAYVGV